VAIILYATQSAASVDQTHYLVTGSLSGGKPAYAWFHKDEFAAGPRAAKTSDHSPGCFTTSPYPIRGDWISTPTADAMLETATMLNTLPSG
jgi:hypothetical protein